MIRNMLNTIIAITILLNVAASVVGKCVIKGSIMNCTGSSLTDCPSANSTVSSLVLDFNNLTSLSTKSCQNWIGVSELSVRNNNLLDDVDLTSFASLTRLDLSHNKIATLEFSGSSMDELDVSDNKIRGISTDDLSALRILRLSKNRISLNSLDGILRLFQRTQRVETIDISFNELSKQTVQWMTFYSNNLQLLNMSNNKMESVWVIGSPVPFIMDLSRNKIREVHVYIRGNAHSLDLSHNNVPLIKDYVLSSLQELQSLDMSYNPIDCSCSADSKAFISWVKQNSNKMQRKNEVFCGNLKNKIVFDVSCSTNTENGMLVYELLRQIFVVKALLVVLFVVLALYSIHGIKGCLKVQHGDVGVPLDHKPILRNDINDEKSEKKERM